MNPYQVDVFLAADFCTVSSFSYDKVFFNLHYIKLKKAICNQDFHRFFTSPDFFDCLLPIN